MDNPYRVSRSAGRWSYLSWRQDWSPPDEHLTLMKRVGRIPGCRLEQDKRQLSVPHTAYMLRDVEHLQDALGVRLVTERRTRERRALDQPPCRSPYPHQAQAAARAVTRGALLLADEMGLGKTLSALVAAKTAAGSAPKLIIAPKFTRSVWRRELAELGYLERGPDCRWRALEGRDFSAGWDPHAEWYFCHYDVVKDWWSKLSSRRPAAVIVDEAHWVKNGRSKRGQGTKLAIGPAPFRILLTGTPLENRPAELWHLLSLTTGFGTWGSPIDFRVRYCGAMHDGFGYKDTEPTNVKELRERLDPWYMRRTLDDAGITLPPLQRQVIECELSEAKLRMHEDLLQGVSHDVLLQALLSGHSGDRALQNIHRLRDLTSQAKFRQTVEYVASVREQDVSVVVFTWQKKTATAMATGFKRDNVYVVHGDIPSRERDAHVDAFQRTGGVLFATIDALKEGVTLHRARHMVIHDLHWTPTAILQAEKRIHRIGQHGACTIAWMVARNTIDELLAQVLTTKIRAVGEVFGEQHTDADEQLADFVYDDSVETLIRNAIAEWREW